jgi:diguanylate cyclase (GGDEF)-like protein/PAS domain S-box-containing protein
MWADASASELKAVTDPIGNPVLMLEVGGPHSFRILCINRWVEEVAGLTHAEVSGELLEQLLPGAVARRLVRRLQRCVDEARRQEYEIHLPLPKGHWWHTTLTPILDAEDRVVRIMANMIEVTRRHELRAELTRVAEELEQSRNRLQLAIIGGEAGVWEWEIPTRRVRMNDAWAPSLRLFDGPADISSHEWVHLLHPDDRAEAIACGERALSGDTQSYRQEYRIRTRGSAWVWLQVHGTVLERDDTGYPLRVWGTYRNITQQKQDQGELRKLAAELRHRALHDSLTAALNHGAILDALEKEMARTRREGSTLMVAFIDADHFKAINDSYGHLAGDQVLTALVERIRAVLRPYDQIGRYGGEEFLVIAPCRNGFSQLHERIRAAVAGSPFPTLAGELEVSVSIGVTTYAGDASSLQEVLHAADRALYRAKEAGRNTVFAEPSHVGEGSAD